MESKRSKKASHLKALPITHLKSKKIDRIKTTIVELDRVLGGGLVPGSAVLIGGDPGIGKSTLLLQAACGLATQGKVLYITGEESLEQVKLRADRIHVAAERILLASGTQVEAALETIEAEKPSVVIIDSIQTMYTPGLSSAPGTVSQVRDCAAMLIQAAKAQGHGLFLVGHVTKEGAIAGPRVLEHMVDAVLYFEGDKGHTHRILRAVKNRFGPAGEIGIFEMHDEGLIGVREASRLFLNDRGVERPGSIVLACMEGTRPLLVEVQALVAPTVYATPKRSAVGLDANRAAMLIAVMDRRLGLPLDSQDIYINIAGGVRIMEPAVDLAVCLAVVSSFKEQPAPPDLVVFGEVGLTGEVRPVYNAQSRLKEAAMLGFTKVIAPTGSKIEAGGHEKVQLKLVRNLTDALQATFG